MKKILTDILKKGFNLAVAAMLLLSVAGFAMHAQKISVNGVKVEISNETEHKFVTEDFVKSLVLPDSLVGGGENQTFELTMGLWELENKIKENPFVENVQVSRDLGGKLLVEITQKKPLARIGSNSLAGGYVTDKGEVIPLSDSYAAKLPVLTGKPATNGQMLDSAYWVAKQGLDLLEFLGYVQSEDFWRAQIEQIVVSDAGELVIYQQIGQQNVVFGPPTMYKAKLAKLKIFYDKIAKQRGWDKYSTVIVKYHNQIVCS